LNPCLRPPTDVLMPPTSGLMLLSLLMLSC